MKFIPKYGVIYKGVLHKGGVVFDIDAKDREEMSRHGSIQDAQAPQAANTVVSIASSETPPETVETKPAKKPGRPKKAVAQ